MRALTLIAGVVLAALWIKGGLAGDWTNDWLIALVVLSLLALPLSFGNDRAVDVSVPQGFRRAPIAIGTVTGVKRTGRTVKGVPQLDIQLQVDTADGRSWVASTRQAAATVELGALLPVRYLTDGRVTPATDAPAHVLQAALDRVHVAKGWLTPKQLRITTYGVDATAVVLAATPTGPTPDGRSGVRLRLLVTRPDGTTFELAQDKKLAPASVQQLRPGMVVQAKYLPYDETDVGVVTEA